METGLNFSIDDNAVIEHPNGEEFDMIIKVLATFAIAVVAVLNVACDETVPESDVGDLAGVVEPFAIEAYQELRPDPQIRSIDLRIDTGFDEREKLPRDAISPIYSPKYVTVAESTLADDELVMGIDINGESRAMPVGLMRFREMVNDVVGGVPILATW